MNRMQLFEKLQQLTEEQQQTVFSYIEKTAEANMALKKLAATEGANEINLEDDAGNVCFSNGISRFATGQTEFEIFHTVSKRFCRKNFGGATEAEVKANIDSMLLKKGRVIGRYFIDGANICIVMDYSKPEADSGKYFVDAMLQEELQNS